MGRNPFPLIVGVSVAVVLLLMATQKPKAEQPASTPVAVKVHPAKPKPAVIVLIDIGGRHCEHCRNMDSKIKTMEREVAVKHLDDEDDSAEVSKWNPSGLPTFIATRDGKEAGRLSGEQSLDALRRLVDKARGKPSADSPASPHCVADVSPRSAPVRSPEGWRLRLFYPTYSQGGQHIRETFENELASFGKKYGFEAIKTNSQRFNEWRRNGYPEDLISLVLIEPGGEVIYYEHRVPYNWQVVRDDLQKAIDRCHGWMPLHAAVPDWQPMNAWSMGRGRR